MRRFIYLSIVYVLATVMVLPSVGVAQQDVEGGSAYGGESGGGGGAAPAGPALPLPSGQGGGEGGQGGSGDQGGSGGGQGGGAGQNVTVSMEDNYFSPAQITVEPGTTVTWVQNGSNPHTTTSYDGLWDSGIIQGGSGQSFSFTFNEPGTYTYFCRPHEAQGMVGSVTVTGGGGGTTAPLPASGGAGIGSPSVLLPAVALLLGSGVLAYAVLRRRR